MHNAGTETAPEVEQCVLEAPHPGRKHADVWVRRWSDDDAEVVGF